MTEQQQQQLTSPHSPETLQKWMDDCVELAYQNVLKGGRPFAAAIFDANGTKIAEAVNEVVWTHDPTSHAEINAIRLATAAMKSTSLEGCCLVMSGESCPMCYAAIMLSKLSECYFCCSDKDEARVGLDTSALYEQLALPKSQRTPRLGHIAASPLLAKERCPFAAWDEMRSK